MLDDETLEDDELFKDEDDGFLLEDDTLEDDKEDIDEDLLEELEEELDEEELLLEEKEDSSELLLLLEDEINGGLVTSIETIGGMSHDKFDGSVSSDLERLDLLETLGFPEKPLSVGS